VFSLALFVFDGRFHSREGAIGTGVAPFKLAAALKRI